VRETYQEEEEKKKNLEKREMGGWICERRGG
jgi:hypothetical protein